MSDYENVYDLLHDIAAEYGWGSSENSEDGTVIISAPGQWQTFDITFGYNEEFAQLCVVGQFRVPVSKRLLPRMYQLVNEINLSSWFGFFTYYAETGLTTWKHAHSFVEADIENIVLIEEVLSHALNKLDGYYPAFQMVAKRGTTPQLALESAMFCQGVRQ